MITTPGTVIDGKTINGSILVQANGVTIRNTKVTNGGIDFPGYRYPGARLTVSHVSVDCGGDAGTTGIGEDGVTVDHANISGCENGFDADQNFTVTNTYVHDLVEPMDCAPCDPHTDGLQSAISSNLDLEHNVIYGDHAPSGNAGGGTSALIMGIVGGTDSEITHNLLAGGAYTIYCPREGSISDFEVTSNVFSRKFEPSSDYPRGNVGAYGPTAYCDRSGITFSGNVYDTGGTVPPVS